MVEIKLKNINLYKFNSERVVINFLTGLFHFFQPLGTVYTYLSYWSTPGTWNVMLQKREPPPSIVLSETFLTTTDEVDSDDCGT